jgi:hypothetical protein
VRRLSDGRTFTDNQNVPTEFAVGKHWSARFRGSAPQFGPFTNEFHYRIVARDSVTVPAGTFNAFRIEVEGYSLGQGGSLQVKQTNWYAPEQVRLVPVQREELLRSPRQIIRAVRTQLASFKQG